LKHWRTKLPSKDPKNQLKFIKNSKNENPGEETLEKKSQKNRKIKEKSIKINKMGNWLSNNYSK